jgi:membrane protein involved in colicin uptake
MVEGWLEISLLKKKVNPKIDWPKYGRGALTAGKYTGIAGKYAAGKAGSGIKKGFGWGKGKWDQRQYNRRYDEALREDAERERMKQSQKAQQAEAEQQKRQYQEQQRTQEKQRAQQEKQQAQQRKQIRYDIKQRINSLKKEYNDLQRQNPRHPRLYEIVKEIKELKRQL